MKIYRYSYGVIEFADIEIDEKSQFRSAVMGDDVVELQFTLNNFIQFEITDFVQYNNSIYYLNQIPAVTKNANNEYSYTLTFEGQKYELGKCLFLLDEWPEFWLYGDADTFVDLIIENMQRIAYPATWTKGVIDTTEFKNLNFKNENCLSVLNRICEELNVEFEVISTVNSYLYCDNVINIRLRIGNDRSFPTLKYKEGIRNIQIQKANDENFVRSLYAYSSDKNIPDWYNSAKRLFHRSYTGSSPEKVVIFEEVYPHFEGIVESCGATYFDDSSIDFDLNDYIIAETPAKVVFLTGDLSGYEFTLSSFNNGYGLKRVTFNTIIDNLLVIPNGDFKIKSGDKYTFVDIKMPMAYITAAEAELKTKADQYIAKYSIPLEILNITFDERYLSENEIVLTAGNSLKIKDTVLGIDKELRILSIAKSIVENYSYTAQLTDELNSDKFIQLKKNQNNTDRKISDLQRQVNIIKNN
jgi:hypothetical protein